MNYIRNIIFVYFLLLSLCGHCQGLSVSSFRLLDKDLTAITSGTMEFDQNGNKAALLKVVTTQTGFSFDCGNLGIVDIKQKPSEYWVYVPAGVRHITVSHPQLGIIRDYRFPVPIESARSYEMVLTMGEVQTIVTQDAGGQYLLMKVNPTSAIISIDDVEIPSENGVATKFLPYGKHTYRISDPLYLDDNGIVEIGKERKELNINLKPNFGILSLTTVPENGAKVSIDDGGTVGGTTPFTTGKLPKGVHRFRFQLPQYSTKDTAIVVDGNGMTKDVTVSMSANFGNVNITSAEGSHIFINNEDKGANRWTGRLTEGLYVVEAKRESYRPTSRNISVVRGQNLDVKLDPPLPIFGMINVNSHPIGAEVYVDGTLVGTTPNVFNNILVGNRELKLKLNGYQDYTEDVLVKENNVSDIFAEIKEQPKYVDLGLSVYWAVTNVGADHPSSLGDFYAWGETETKDKYLWENYKFGNGRRLSKYSLLDHKRTLEEDDDVAHKRLGAGWHIPTIREWNELRKECTWTWSSKDGIQGYIVRAKNGNSIFLPATGYYYGSHGFVNRGIEGDYWTSDVREYERSNAANVKFNKEQFNFYGGSRCCGFSVRAVKAKASNNDDNKSNTEELNSEDNVDITHYSNTDTSQPSKVDKHDKVFKVAEVMPKFRGNIMQWLSMHIHYPSKALENGVEGRVVVKFVVGKDGSIGQAEVVQSVDPVLDHEALRVVNMMPRWEPGYLNGEPVSTWYSMPLDFKLSN